MVKVQDDLRIKSTHISELLRGLLDSKSSCLEAKLLEDRSYTRGIPPVGARIVYILCIV